MTRINAVSLFMVAVLVLAVLVVAFAATGSISSVVLHADHKSSSTLSVEVTAPAASGVMADDCGGCSGGGSGG